MVDFSEIAFGVVRGVLEIMRVSWWIILPVGLFFIFVDYWDWGLKKMYRKKMKWIFLEIKVPKNILKTPKAMENIFTALHSIVSGPLSWEDIHLEGKVVPWYSFELVGYAGGVNFYVRAPEDAKNLIETAIYSEYPDAEIAPADDYVNSMPSILPNEIYDIWGNEYILDKANPYPIKTYSFFEAQVEEQRMDPVSAITEVMSRLKEGEAIWLQYLMKPVSDEWKKEGEEIRDKMLLRKKPEKKPSFMISVLAGLFEFLRNLTKALFVTPTWSEAKSEEKVAKTPYLSPREKEILEAVENKISKYGYEAAIRFVYIDRADEFTKLNVSAVTGAFKQFGTQDMNSFKIFGDTKTSITGAKLTYKSWFRKSRLYAKKRAIYDSYKARAFPSKFSVLNTEELATIYHFPLSTVEAPMLRRLETRKGEPPSTLPTI